MKKFFLRHRHYLLIIFPLFIFIYSIWDHNFYIGGDVMVPLNPVNNIQKMFLWDNGLESFQYAGFLWFAFYYLFFLIGLPVFVIQKILLVLLLIVGFVFMYLSHKELFKNTKYSDPKLSFLAAVIFTFNPIYFLLAGAGLFLYGFPVCFYFLIKFLQKSKTIYAVLFSLLLNFFFFTDLPQPKLLIIFSIACFFLILVYGQIRKLSFKNLFRQAIMIFLLSFLLNAWVFIPLLYSMFLGAGASFVKGVGTHGGEADFKIATLTYIMRFFNYNIVKYYPRLEHFLVSPMFIVWTFVQWIVLILGVFFAAKDRKNSKIIYTLALPILLFIFIAKGANSPLGELYRTLIIYFPLAKIFRTTSSVIAGAVVFYAFLLSISAYYLSRKKRVIVHFIIILNIAIFYPLYFGYKFYNQLSSAPNQKGYYIPRQYYEMGKQLDNIKEDSKVLSIPLTGGYVDKDWPYFGPDILSWITIKPLIYREGGYGLSGMRDGDIQIIPKNCGAYSLNNIKHLLFQKDSVGAESLHEDLSFSELLIRNSYFDLYKIKNECFLPHFYIPQNIIYLNGDVESLSDVVNFDDHKIRSEIYLEDLKPGSSAILERTDEIFVKADLESEIIEEELNRLAFAVESLEIEDVFFPYVRWKPGSLAYPLMLKREEFSEWKEKNDLKQLFEKKLFYAAKRISEIEKWGAILDENDWKETADKYEQKMKGTFELLGKIKQEEKENVFPLLDKLKVSLEAHRRKLKNLKLDKGKKVQFENIFDDLEGKINQIEIKHDFSRLIYKFDIPKEGEYEMFIKADNVDNNRLMVSMTLMIDEKKINTEELRINGNEWINLKKRSFKKGEHKLALRLSEAENLITENWREFRSFEMENGILFFSPVFQEIRDYTPETIFRASFDYKARNGRAAFSIIQDTSKDEKSEEINPSISKILRKTYNEEFGHAEILFKSHSQTSSAKLYLFPQPGEAKIAEITFKNVRVEKISEPAILFRTETDSVEKKQIVPKVTFAKVNPTKYRVKIEGAKKPYNLVFSESFHKGWKAYIDEQQIMDNRQQNEEIIASYFAGEIEEEAHRNIFLDRNTFETWGKKPISENRHYLVNGYANSWYINPEDADGKENYEIIIEFQPQRSLYVGLGIALLTFLGCLGYLGYNFAKKRRESRK